LLPSPAIGRSPNRYSGRVRLWSNRQMDRDIRDMWNFLRRFLPLRVSEPPPSDPLEWRSSPAPPGPSSGPADPYAWRSARLKPRPRGRAGAVAVAEPDEDVREDAVSAARKSLV
jgi:hypothetical protein